MDSDESGHDENEFYYPDEEDYNEIQQQNESGEDEHFSKMKNKNVICRPRSVRIGENCALGLEHGRRPTVSGRTQDLGHSFSLYGPPGRQITYTYLCKNIYC